MPRLVQMPEPRNSLLMQRLPHSTMRCESAHNILLSLWLEAFSPFSAHPFKPPQNPVLHPRTIPNEHRLYDRRFSHLKMPCDYPAAKTSWRLLEKREYISLWVDIRKRSRHIRLSSNDHHTWSIQILESALDVACGNWAIERMQSTPGSGLWKRTRNRNLPTSLLESTTSSTVPNSPQTTQSFKSR